MNMEELDLNSLKISEQNFVKHEGVISKISESSVTVSLKGNVNCEGCKAKAACGTSESNDKEIEVLKINQSFALNETVQVVLEKKLGLKAVFWAYIFPFILMISVLIIATSFFKEWVAGLLSLFVLIPYYLMLYLLNNTLKKTFNVSILKFN